ncbi:hypothetical protein AWB83_04793 [Caballeronia ptereochthonis]|uniref:Uncharacterized protein n=1 Tax=Caballeronia ptereochthonis TaxID=1777144 RepID=A0A158CY70_9BURK|nr:hypothetical protein AWB83_04793 [Caballeronia ptereochthonis]
MKHFGAPLRGSIPLLAWHQSYDSGANVLR